MAQNVVTNPTVAHWRAFWAGKQDPAHRSTDESFFRTHAAELSVLFGGRDFGMVLEIGCGTGSLYPYLGFETSAYRGVDLSETMLARFDAAHRSLDLICADGSEYRDDHKYDLVFSNGAVQYFDKPMLERHIQNASAMMHEHSLLIAASVLWRDRRRSFNWGRLTPPYRIRPDFVARSVARSILRRPDRLGYWYSFEDFRTLASKHGLDVHFYGSISYLYRFHAVFQRSK
jgi:SAM-dependent methyltransferase